MTRHHAICTCYQTVSGQVVPGRKCEVHDNPPHLLPRWLVRNAHTNEMEAVAKSEKAARIAARRGEPIFHDE